jgi:hypothetical protein
MPVHMSHTVQWGSTGRSVLVFAHDDTGRAVTGLTARSAGAAVAYVREGEEPSSLVLVDGDLDEVDAGLVPGLYRLRLPDEMLAVGSPHAVLIVRFAGAIVDPIEFELVAYDPLDPSCIGMSQLGDRKRHEFLRRALPRFTEMEYEAGMDKEKRLSDLIDSNEPGA